MSVEVWEWAWRQDCRKATKLLLLILADHADREGKCWPSVARLAEYCGITDRNVRKHMVVLVKKGLVEVQPRYDPEGDRTSNLYILKTNAGVPPRPRQGRQDRPDISDTTHHVSSDTPPRP
jgi:predicted ArsR family transcriptional regulator